MSQDDCVAHATDIGRSTCHAGLLEECLLQQAVRGPADPRLTLTCSLSAEACAGQLPGDLSVQALAAQHETEQVEVQEAMEELSRVRAAEPEGGAPLLDPLLDDFEATLATWDGGMPVDVSDASQDRSDSGTLPDGSGVVDGQAADL